MLILGQMYLQSSDSHHSPSDHHSVSPSHVDASELQVSSVGDHLPQSGHWDQPRLMQGVCGHHAKHHKFP